MRLLRLLRICVLTALLTACDKSTFDMPSDLTSGNLKDSVPTTGNSKLTVSPTNVADGISAAIVTLELRNAKNLPIKGMIMTLAVSGTQNTIMACSASNASGISTCTFYSTKAEAKTVMATGVISLSGTTVFTAVPYTKSVAGIVSSGSYQKISGAKRLISSSGIVESPTRMKDSFGTVRAHTSIQSKMTGQ